jgi:hypothetical protein
MSYNSAIPIGTDAILKSQRQILANFQAINEVWGRNHSSLTGNQDFQGMHNVLTMNRQTGDPSTDGTHVALYNKFDASSVPELFFRPISNQTPIQLTYGSISTGIASTNPTVYKTRQYSFIPGPFIFYMGNIAGVMDSQTITLTPTSTLKYVGLSIVGTLGGYVVPFAITGSSFNVKYFSTGSPPLPPGFTATISYIAIGQP